MAIAAPNGAAASFAFLGAVYGGFRATPLNLLAGVKTLAFVLSHSETELILCADDSRSLMNEALAALVSAGETPPRVISMDVNDGPRWSETDITPAQPDSLRVPTKDSIGLLMYTSAPQGFPKASCCHIAI